jgi:germination protein M
MGYLVPVAVQIPKQDGVAKATLNLMTGTEENDINAARMGLYTVLPESLEVDIDIANKVAKVSLSNDANQLRDAMAERDMIGAIVQTLTEFESISEVQFMVNGFVLETLKNGTPVSLPIARTGLNQEASITDDDANSVSVFFESESSGCFVPVTRPVYSYSDMETAVLELMRGPKQASGLKNAMPQGVGLLGISLKDGVATINMTGEFNEVLKNSDGGEAAIKALVLTCSQFDDVKQVKIQVEGEHFELDSDAWSRLTTVNTQEEAYYTSAQIE